MSAEPFRWRAFDALSPRELHDVLRLRQDVFVIEQTCLFPEIDGRDPAAVHLLARDARHVLVGTLRLFGPEHAEGAASIGRVATAAAARGTGLGHAMMAEAVAETERRFGAVPIRLGAQTRLERFYERFGFRRDGDDYLEDGILHCAMRRT